MNTDRIKHILAVWESVEECEPDISTERLMETVKHVAKCSHDELMGALAYNSNKPTTPAKSASPESARQALTQPKEGA